MAKGNFNMAKVPDVFILKTCFDKLFWIKKHGNGKSKVRILLFFVIVSPIIEFSHEINKVIIEKLSSAIPLSLIVNVFYKVILHSLEQNID